MHFTNIISLNQLIHTHRGGLNTRHQVQMRKKGINCIILDVGYYGNGGVYKWKSRQNETYIGLS